MDANDICARRRRGFTLVEILVVLAIISLLAGVVLVNVAPNLMMGQQATAKAQIKEEDYCWLTDDFMDEALKTHEENIGKVLDLI